MRETAVKNTDKGACSMGASIVEEETKNKQMNKSVLGRAEWI